MSQRSSFPLPDRRLLSGIAFVALIGLVMAGTVASYRGTFDDTVTVSLRADRAGQTLAPGAVVKLRGVEVGTVSSVEPSDDGVSIELALDSDAVARIPADVTAQIVPPTAFGAKYVQLSDPEGGSGPIQAGAVLEGDRVTVEVDQAFSSLTGVLEAARPAEVSGALTALADTVDTRGRRIGELVEAGNAYLNDLNPALDALATDLKLGDDVADTYAAVRPDLVTTLDALAVSGHTLSENQRDLRDLSVGLQKFSARADGLVRSIETPLAGMLQQAAPVTKVLARYAPELPCTIEGLGRANKLAEAAVGGTHPGVTTVTRVVPARDPYAYPQELPQVGDDTGPHCRGLPWITPQEAAGPAASFRSGANPYSGPQPDPADRVTTTLVNLLLGGGNLL
ncbi:MCE family protein [Nocardioides sp. Bht2]|uniref:MCE family protein n=1 Tax=Nocardioides sp. Bht2 TaxID=3392297 RepID=UPI0039B68135